jgi:ketosteroid isomerase-like protein
MPVSRIWRDIAGAIFNGRTLVLVLATGTITVVVAANLSGRSAQPAARTDPAIESIMVKLLDALNQKDGPALEAFYLDDAVMMPPDEPIVRGRVAIRAHYEREWKAGFLPMKAHSVESAISGTTAFNVSTITLGGGTGTGASGSLSAKAVLIFKRSGNTWKIAYDIFNDDAPFPPTKK